MRGNAMAGCRCVDSYIFLLSLVLRSLAQHLDLPVTMLLQACHVFLLALTSSALAIGKPADAAIECPASAPECLLPVDADATESSTPTIPPARQSLALKLPDGGVRRRAGQGGRRAVIDVETPSWDVPPPKYSLPYTSVQPGATEAAIAARAAGPEYQRMATSRPPSPLVVRKNAEIGLRSLPLGVARDGKVYVAEARAAVPTAAARVERWEGRNYALGVDEHGGVYVKLDGRSEQHDVPALFHELSGRSSVTEGKVLDSRAADYDVDTHGRQGAEDVLYDVDTHVYDARADADSLDRRDGPVYEEEDGELYTCEM
jgi:hypothetical protein